MKLYLPKELYCLARPSVWLAQVCQQALGKPMPKYEDCVRADIHVSLPTDLQVKVQRAADQERVSVETWVGAVCQEELRLRPVQQKPVVGTTHPRKLQPTGKINRPPSTKINRPFKAVRRLSRIG